MLCSIQLTAGGVCSTDLCSKTVGVLKGVNSDVKHKGLERSQFGLKGHICHSSDSRCPHRVLDEVQRLMLKAGMTFCQPISSSCMMQGVKYLAVGLPVLGRVLGME